MKGLFVCLLRSTDQIKSLSQLDHPIRDIPQISASVTLAQTLLVSQIRPLKFRLSDGIDDRPEQVYAHERRVSSQLCVINTSVCKFGVAPFIAPNRSSRDQVPESSLPGLREKCP
jgi:hypothetical protein